MFIQVPLQSVYPILHVIPQVLEMHIACPFSGFGHDTHVVTPQESAVLSHTLAPGEAELDAAAELELDAGGGVAKGTAEPGGAMRLLRSTIEPFGKQGMAYVLVPIRMETEREAQSLSLSPSWS